MDTPIERVRDLLHRPRSSADFSPAARYAAQRLADYAEQEHEQREKAETMLCGERRKALAFSAEMARQERTIDDLRQQLSFLQQAMRMLWLSSKPTRISALSRRSTSGQ